MELGAFSVSLAVKDLQASHEFYGKLGFEVTGGNESENWLILKNGITIIGLFQGIIENNILTFNPGLDNNTDRVEDFTDVRQIQASLKEQGVALEHEVDADTEGPGHISFLDPDGNAVLIDQFF